LSVAEQQVVPWLGQTPTDWEIKPLYSLGHEVEALNWGLVEDNLLSLSYGEIKRKDIEANIGLLPESFETYQIVEPGDMVFRFTDLQNDQKSLRSGLVKERGIITNAYVGFRPRGVNSRYFNYLMRAYDFAGVFYSMGSGLRQSLNYSDVRRLPVIVPPLEEQRRIADQLDKDLAENGLLVEKYGELISRLREFRLGLITDKVTPAHTGEPAWVRKPLKRVARIFGSNVDKKTVDGEVPVLLCNYTDVYYNDFITGGIDFMEASAPRNQVRKFALRRDWVLITKDSESAEDIGVSSLVSENLDGVLCGYHLSVLEPNAGVSGLFLKWFFDSARTREELAKRARGSTRVGLSSDAIGSLPIALPPLQQQIQLAEEVREDVSRIDVLIAEAIRARDLIGQRSRSLVSEVVTGGATRRDEHDGDL
jgi:type I restriction enzyme S subunit